MLKPSQRLAQLVKDSLESQWRQQVQSLLNHSALTEPLLTDQVGELSALLASELEETDTSVAVKVASPAHSLNLGVALEEVVAELNLLRSCVFELAAAHQVPIAGNPLLIVNRVVDSAIAGAVKAMADQQSQCMEKLLASAVHDLRSPLAALALAADLLERLVHPVPESEERALLDIMRSSVKKQDLLFHRVLSDDLAT